MRVLYAFILSMFCLTLVMPQSAFGQAPSAFDFMKPAKNSGLKISPSGRYVAFTQISTKKFCLNKVGRIDTKRVNCKDKDKAYNSTYSIIIYDLEKGQVAKSLPAPENYVVGWLDFASDDRLLASIGTRTTVGQNGRGWKLGGSRIISVTTELNVIGSSEQVFLFNDQNSVQRGNRRLTNVVNMLKHDPDHIMMAARKGGDLDLWKVNVLTGAAIRVERGSSDTIFWYTSKKGKPLLRYDCYGRFCRTIKVYAPGKEVGKWQKIRSVKIKDDEDLKDSAFYPAALTDNENEILILSDEDKDERRSVKVYDLEKQTYTRTVYQHPTMDVGGVLTSTSTGDYMGVWLVEDRLKYVIENNTLQKHYNALNTFFDNEANVRLVGYNEKGTKSIVFVDSHNAPGTYYIYDFETKAIEPLISSEPEIESKLSSGGRIVKIPVRDGNSITAYHFYPKGQQAGQPLIVMPHGGPHSRDAFTFDYYVQYFVARGYQVVQMNFRGSSGYGRTFEEAGYGEWGGLMQDDITDTTKYFHDRGLATPDKTCIVGYSFGGYSALMGGATTPELYKCIVSGGGISDLNKLLKEDKNNLSEEGYEHMKETLALGDPKGSKAMLTERSPINYVDKFEDPVLLVHGEWDGRVEVHHARKMEKALERAGKEVTYLELEEEGHSNWDLENEILYLETLEAFLEQHIGR